MDRRTRILLGIAAVVVIGGVVLVAVLLAGDDDEEDVGAGDTTTTTEASTTTTDDDATTTTAAAGDGAPPEVVAVDRDGQVVVLDAPGGEVQRVLLEGVRVDDPAKNGIAVSPDRSTVFVVRPAPDGATTAQAEIVRLDVGGGDAPEVVAEGFAPSVSPDGRRLVYAVAGADPGPEATASLVIHDLETGDEQQLDREDEPPFQFVADTAWLDDDRIAFVAGEIRTGAYVVDADAASLDEAQRLGPDARGDASWRELAVYDGELAVVESCCDVPQTERWFVALVSVDPPELQGGLLPEERVEATDIDSDEAGEHLLYVVQGGPGGGDLYRWTEGNPPERLASGIVVAAW